MCLQKICGLINRLILLVNVDRLPTIKHTYKRGEVMTKKKKKKDQRYLLPRSRASLTHHRFQLVQEDGGGGVVTSKLE